MSEAVPEGSASTPAPVSGRRGVNLLVEFVLIVTGVLLALAVDEWREEAERDRLARQVLVNVAEELSESIATIDGSVPYKEAMLPKLDRALQAITTEGRWTFPPEGYEGIRDPELTVAAYESALLTGVLPRLRADTVRSLARVDQLREDMARTNERQAQELLQTDFSDGERYLRLVQLRFTDGLAQERRLRAAMAEALTRVEAEIAARD